MAKDTKKKEKEKKPDSYSDYPIKTLFQISILAGAFSFVFIFANSGNIMTAIFRSFVIFSAFAIFGGLLMVTIVSIFAKMREAQMDEMRERIEQEQKEFFEQQLRLQEEIDRLANEHHTKS